MAALPEEALFWVEVLIVPTFLLVISQFVKCHGWCKCPALYNNTERKIMFRPIQNGSGKKIFVHGEALIGTKALIGLQNDMIATLERSVGGMLCVCAPFGHGKTMTSFGAALARHDGMPQRVLCLSPGGGDPGWYGRVKRIAGIPLHFDGFGGACRLYDAMSNKRIATKLSRRFRFVDHDAVASRIACPKIEDPCNYGVLVIEDYNPKELKDLHNKSVDELEEALVDKQAVSFLRQLAEKAHRGRVIVVITTTCKNTLRWIHHGINGGHKAKAAPFSTRHAGNYSVKWASINMPQDHIGMPWDQDSRNELFNQKYIPFVKTAEGSAMLNGFGEDETIRECCDQLFHANGCSCAKVYPGAFAYLSDFVLDPIQRLFCCQPACGFVDGCTGGGDVELGSFNYGIMA